MEKTLERSSCNIASLNRLRREYGDFFLVVTQKGCGACPPALSMLRKTTKGTRIPIVRLPAEQFECGNFAVDRLHIDDTPTILLFQKGKRPRKVKGEEQLKRLVSRR